MQVFNDRTPININVSLTSRNAPKHRYSPLLDPTPNLWLNQSNKHTQGLTLAIVRTGMKGMTETKRVGGKRIDVRPTWTNDMQSRKKRVLIQQVIKRSADISLMYTYKLWRSEWIMIQTSCSKTIKRLYNASKSTCQVKWCTMVSLYMWNDKKKTWQKSRSLC